MPVFALLVISKAGSLIYHRTFPTNSASAKQPPSGTLGLPGTTTLTTNDYLVLAGTFHGVHAITRSLTPKLPYVPPPTTTTAGAAGGGGGGISTATSTRESSIFSPQNSSTPLQAPPTGTTIASTINTPGTATTITTTNQASTSNLSTTSRRTFSYPDPTQPATGIESLESSFFRLTVFQTPTGTKFLLFTDPSMPNTDTIMKGVYERFADYVCKNPFWQMEMPIRIESWEREVTKWLTRR